MASLLLLSTLSEGTKKAVIKLNLEVIGRLLKYAIDKINHGSVKGVDEMMRNRI